MDGLRDRDNPFTLPAYSTTADILLFSP